MSHSTPPHHPPRGQQRPSTLHLEQSPNHVETAKCDISWSPTEEVRAIPLAWVRFIFIWNTNIHTYMQAQICDVCHWFCGGGCTHFFSLLSSWTGLSICQPQSFLLKTKKLSCRIRSAFLSWFPFGSAESLQSGGEQRFVVSVPFLCCTFEVAHKTTCTTIDLACLKLCINSRKNFLTNCIIYPFRFIILLGITSWTNTWLTVSWSDSHWYLI